jgi:hypothetical protein
LGPLRAAAAAAKGERQRQRDGVSDQPGRPASHTGRRYAARWLNA